MNVFDLQATLGIDTKKFTDGLSKAKSAAQTFAKVGAAAFAAVGAGVVASTTAMVKGVKEVAAYGDNIDKMSQKIGISAEAYQEWDAVLQHSGTSISVLQTGMKTLRNAMDNLGDYMGEAVVDQAKLQQAQLTYKNKLEDVKKAQIAYNSAVAKSGENSDAAKKALINLEKAQNNAEIAASKVAQAAEGEKVKLSEAGQALLDLGVSAVDANGNLRDEEEVFNDVITALQNMDNETERTRLATVLLGRSGTELGALLNTSAEETQAMKDRVHELGGVMSDEAVKNAAAFQDQLQDMNTAIAGIKRNILSGFLPAFTKFTSGITEIASGNVSEGIEKALEGISDIFQKLFDELPKISQVLTGAIKTIVTSITNNAPALVSSVVSIINEVVSLISTAAPELLDIVLQIITGVAQSIIDNTPALVSGIIKVVKVLVKTISTLLPTLVKAALNVAIKLVKELAKELPNMIGMLVDTIIEVVNILTDPEIISQINEAAIELITALIQGIVNAIPKLINALPKIIGNIIQIIISTKQQINVLILKVVGVILEALPLIVEALNEFAPDLIKEVILAFVKAMPEAMMMLLEAVLELLPTLISSIIELIVALFIEGLPVLIKGIVEAIPEIIDAIMKSFSSMPNKFGGVFGKAWENAKAVFSKTGKFFSGVWDTISGTFSSVGTFFSTTFSTAWGFITDAFSKAKGFFEGVWSNIKGAFTHVTDWFKDIFEKAWNAVKNVFSATGSTFKSIGDGLLNGLKSIVNNLIKGINDVIVIPFKGLNDSLNAIKNMDILGTKPFNFLNTIAVPKIPYLAQGGVLKKGQRAFLEGQGDEAVIPLSQNTEWIDKVADKLSDRQAPQISIVINVDKMGQMNEEDIEDFADKLMEVISQKAVRGRYAMS